MKDLIKKKNIYIYRKDSKFSDVFNFENVNLMSIRSAGFRL